MKATLITLLVTLPIIIVGTWLYLRHPKSFQRVCKARARFATVASLVCGIPCCLVTLAAVLLCFAIPHSEPTWETVMLLGSISLCLSPLAIAAVAFSAFAASRRGLCFGVSTAYFVGWAVILLFQ